MIPRLNATQFHRFMGSGRTSPALCGCEDDQGNRAGDYVVKLLGGVERGEEGMQCELLASGLAAYFGIGAPEPALVWIEAPFAELIAESQPARAARIRSSVGLNFATHQLNDVTIWPVDRAIPESMWQAAMDIFSFDALIENPDRRSGNPNLFSRGDDFFVYDHELAFSFLLEILPSPTPWTLNGQPYLNDHVFYRRLRGQPMEITGFTVRLHALRANGLDTILANAPPEWNNGCLPRLENHLRAMSAHAEQFAEEIKRRLG